MDDIKILLGILFAIAGGVLFLGTLVAGLSGLCSNTTTHLSNLLVVHVSCLCLVTSYFLLED